LKKKIAEYENKFVDKKALCHEISVSRWERTKPDPLKTPKTAE